MFVGHAETLHDMDLPLTPVAPALYRRPMPQPEATLPEVYVQPGESRLVTEPTMMRTLLGSCVGITFRAPRLGVGALCHPMLPRLPTTPGTSPARSAGRRYVDYAIRDLAMQFDALGAAAMRLR